MKESTVEDYLSKLVEKHDGICEKHTSPGRRGPPDRLVTWPWGDMDLVELKRPRGRLEPWQVRDHAARAKRGVPVYLLDTTEKVDMYMRERLQRGRPSWLFSCPLMDE